MIARCRCRCGVWCVMLCVCVRKTMGAKEAAEGAVWSSREERSRRADPESCAWGDEGVCRSREPLRQQLQRLVSSYLGPAAHGQGQSEGTLGKLVGYCIFKALRTNTGNIVIVDYLHVRWGHGLKVGLFCLLFINIATFRIVRLGGGVMFSDCVWSLCTSVSLWFSLAMAHEQVVECL